jgi:single-stranded-DNA-specific exonuclease
VRRRWLVNRTNPEFIDYISKEAAISPLLARVLINRGIKTASAARDFLNPGILGLSDPFGLPGITAAVERIKAAVARRERVLVHGDYDTDGLTSAVIMVETLRKLGLNADCFIPNRIAHGYGFSTVAVDEANKRGTKLIVTVDCGITSFEAAACARKAGIDVIITDHHEPLRKKKVQRNQESVVSSQTSDSDPEFVLPEVVAIVNPKISSFSSRLTPHTSLLDMLSGAGVAFEVARALAIDGTLPFSADDAISLLDLAALGTLADVVPLRGENRHILKEGIRHLQEAKRPGIKALKEVCGLDKKRLRAGLLAFSIVPRINAAGRLADAGDVVRLLLTDDYSEACDISSRLDSLNAERQRIEEDVYRHALSKLEDKGADAVIVVSGEGWHEGVLGIVASRLAEKFYRPAFVFTVENGFAKGSARSIPAFDICRGLDGCRELLFAYGGHKQAAGVRLKAENIPLFEVTIKDIARRSISEDDLIPVLQIDAGVELREITHSLVRELEMLEPLGYGNAEPLFGARGLDVISPKTVGNNHLKMRLGKNGQSFDAIGFNMSAIFEDLGGPAGIDAVFVPSFNEWNGNKYLQLILRDIRPSG